MIYQARSYRALVHRETLEERRACVLRMGMRKGCDKLSVHRRGEREKAREKGRNTSVSLRLHLFSALIPCITLTGPTTWGTATTRESGSGRERERDHERDGDYFLAPRRCIALAVVSSRDINNASLFRIADLPDGDTTVDVT